MSGPQPASLRDAIARISPPPCDDCEHRARCGACGLACVAYARYLNGTKPSRLPADREPSAAIYDQTEKAYDE